MKEVEAIVKRILMEQLGIDGDELVAHTKLVDDLGVDSLDMVEVWMAIEDEFGVSVPDEEAEKCKTVGEVIDLVKAKLRG